MAVSEKRLSHLTDIQNTDISLNRSLLKDRVANTLRDYISSGRIPEGTKLTEREVSVLLGISRAPARDALMALEAEGLIVSKSSGRYVIELTEKDVRDIHVLRWTLEKLAAEQAAKNNTPENQTLLGDALEQLEEAGARGDANYWAQSDMLLHRTIWRMADNTHLLKVLDSVLGAIFVLAERNKIYGKRNFEYAIARHRELVDLIIAGEDVKAGLAMEAHLRRSLAQNLETYQLSKRTNESLDDDRQII